ncbi:MAG TPA: hypothetical protein VLT87_02935 [Thermoanaerobaculia bacterium]|nr:hypothetical protein [Thermoanaerobaculia bacterium]
MRKAPTVTLVTLVALLALGLGALISRAGEEASKDPLAQEIARASAILHSHTETQGVWADVKQSSQPILARAEEDLRAGRRLVAVQRLGSVKTSLATAAYVSEHSAQGKDEAVFAAEWERMGGTLRADLGPPSPTALEGVGPAAVRALAEGTMPQVRLFYESSIEYGRSSMPGEGLYYLASAQAKREALSLFRALATPAERRAPPVRPLAAELDRLEEDILEAYRPPASIDRHAEFISASATLKEARELDAAGLRYGALLRYLQAAQRIAPLRSALPALDAGALAERLAEFDRRLAAGDVDHSLGRLFLETAEADADAEPGKTPPSAVWIASDVLPRYFAALEPGRPAAPKPDPQVTVTLVRWPYT